jgi:hypothetical protein
MRALILVMMLAITGAAQAKEPPRLEVSRNGRFLVTPDGKPFFWLGDTAWRLQRLAPADLAAYLDTRKAQGFNVIQGPILVRDAANYRGDANNDPAHPDEPFFEHIDRIVAETARRGLYSALVVTWGHEYGRLGGPDGARRLGAWLGRRYRDRGNVIWIVAGEYAIDSHDEASIAVWRALGEGLRAAGGGRHLITVHGAWNPPPLQTSSTYFHDEPFLSFNMIQSSQGGNTTEGAANWRMIDADYRRSPPKPVIDGEATYEGKATAEIPSDWDGFGVRRRAYWSVFAGAFGHTYGARKVFYFEDDWRAAMYLEGAVSMIHLRRLMESRPMLGRIPDAALVIDPVTPDRATCDPAPVPCGVPDHVQATRDANGRFAMIYVPGGESSVTVDSNRLSGTQLVAWWYDPRDGRARRIGRYDRQSRLIFTSPPGEDWVLVIDDAARRYGPPGSRKE